MKEFEPENILLSEIRLPKNLEAARRVVLEHISTNITGKEFLQTSRNEIVLNLPANLLSSKNINAIEKLRHYLLLRLEVGGIGFDVYHQQGLIRVTDRYVQVVNQDQIYNRELLEQYTVIYYLCNRRDRDILESADALLRKAVSKISIAELIYDWYPKAVAGCHSERERYGLSDNFANFLMLLLEAVDDALLDPENQKSRIVSKTLQPVTKTELDKALTCALANYLDIEPDPEYIIVMLCWFGIDKCNPMPLDDVGMMFVPTLSRTAVKDRIERCIARYSAFLHIHPINIWRFVSVHGISGLPDFLAHFKNARSACRFLCLVCDKPYSPAIVKQLTRIH